MSLKRMIILTLRTDKPEAEIGLFNCQDQLAYIKWLAHRELAETIHAKILELLTVQSMGLHGIQGIVCYKGPGSFTGLRIGLTVANALAYGLQIPIVAMQGLDWLEVGVRRLDDNENDIQALPHYGADVYITPPKK